MFRVAGALFYRASLNGILNHKATEEEVEYEPTVTFVIPCLNEEGAIQKTIEKCFAAEYPKEKLEVIVINDGSTDNTPQILQELKATKFPELVIVNWEENKGKRPGMATGFRMAKGEIVIQLDSDSYIEPHTFRQMITPFVHPDVGAVSGHTDPENADENFITKMQAAYYFISFRIMKASESTFHTVFCCSGCASAFRKSAVLPFLDKWLNERFLGAPVTYGDDRALTSWLLKNNFKTVYKDNVQAFTIVPTKMKKLFKQQLRWKKSWIINAFFTGRFIVFKQPFVALFYFYPLVLISYLSPIMAFRSIFYQPISYGRSPVYYLLGVFAITIFVIVYGSFFSQKRKYLSYFLYWQILNTFAFIYIIYIAAFKIKDRGWGTR